MTLGTVETSNVDTARFTVSDLGPDDCYAFFATVGSAGDRSLDDIGCYRVTPASAFGPFIPPPRFMLPDTQPEGFTARPMIVGLVTRRYGTDQGIRRPFHRLIHRTRRARTRECAFAAQLAVVRRRSLQSNSRVTRARGIGYVSDAIKCRAQRRSTRYVPEGVSQP